MAENIISEIVKELIIVFSKAIVLGIFIAIIIGISFLICIVGIILSFFKSRIWGAINILLLIISIIFALNKEVIPIIALAAYFVVTGIILIILKIIKKIKKK